MKYERKESRSYYYNHVDEEISTVITAGENGVTQEDIDILLDLEYEEKKKREERDRKEVEYNDAIESEIIDDDNSMSSEEAIMKELIDTLLTPMQQDLVYKHFGRSMYLEDIAKERGVTRQAIYGQLQTIKRKLEKEYRKRMEI